MFYKNLLILLASVSSCFGMQQQNKRLIIKNITNLLAQDIINLKDIQKDSQQKITETNFSIHNIKELPIICVELISELAKQPLYTKDAAWPRSKVLPMNLDKILVITNLNDSSETYKINHLSIADNTKLDWLKYGFEVEEFYEKHPQQSCIKSGLLLPLLDNNPEIYSREKLLLAYKQVIENISKDWKVGKQEDYPGISPRNTNEYILLIKNGKNAKENLQTSSLIRSLHNDIFDQYTSCDEVKNINLIYWWVKKDSLPKIIDSFNLEISGK